MRDSSREHQRRGRPRWWLPGPLVAGLLLLGAGPATAEVARAAIEGEVKAAFEAYEQIPCVDLTFQFKGTPAPSTSLVRNAVVVFFGDETNWTAGGATYHVKAQPVASDGLIDWASIGLNSMDWWWSTDGSPGTMDIRTTLLKLIPGVLGYYVGSDFRGFSVDVSLGVVDHQLGELRRTGARASYLDEGGVSCGTPDQPGDCHELAAPSDDAGGAGGADAGSVGDQLCVFRTPADAQYPLHWEQRVIDVYIYIPADGKLPGGTGEQSDGGAGTSDGGLTDGDGGSSALEGSSGCCRLVHTGEEGPWALAFWAAALIGYRLRRRRRR